LRDSASEFDLLMAGDWERYASREIVK
jgi:hypothetical protein